METGVGEARECLSVRGLRRGLDDVVPYAGPEEKWPEQQIDPRMARAELVVLRRRATMVYREKSYEDLLSKHFADRLAQQRWQLLWPG